MDLGARSTTHCDFEIILSSGSFAIQANTTIEKGSWNHIASVFGANNKQNIKIYRNSELVASSSVGSFDVGKVLANVTIGSGSKHEAYATTFTPQQTLSGALDELRFWHEARSQKQVKAFSNGTVFNEEALRLYYRFNEPSGSFGTTDRAGNSDLVLDYSGNGLHAAVANFDMALRESRGLAMPVTMEGLSDAPVLFPSFSKVLDLNEDLVFSASNYDHNNPNLITKLVPKHYLQEAALFEGFTDDIGDINSTYGYNTDVPGGGKIAGAQLVAALLYTMAASMDELKLFISEFGRLLTIDVKDDRTISDQFLPFLAKYYGLNLPDAFANASIQQLQDADGLNFNKVLSNLSLQKIQNTIWRRILTDLPELLRTKGTRHSIEAVLRNIGIRPGSLFRIREYGGSRRKSIRDSFEKRTEIAAMLDFSGSFAAGGTIDTRGIDSSRPFLSTPFLSASRIEPGIPLPRGNIGPHGSDVDADRLFTSGSWAAETRVKFGGDQHLRQQSLVRLQTTGSQYDGSTNSYLLFNVVAYPPVTSSNTTGSLTLYGRPTPGTSAPTMELILTGVNVFDGNKWHVSFGRQRHDYVGSVATSSYFFRAGRMTTGRMAAYHSTDLPFDDGGDNAMNKVSGSYNASGSFLAIGSQSLLYDTDPTFGFLNTATDAKARTTLFTGKMCGLRFYSKTITEEETINHVKNFKSIGIGDPLINFSFNTVDSGTFERVRVNVHTDQPLTRSNSEGKIQLFDFSQNLFHASGEGFEPNKTVIKPERFDYEILSPRFELATATNKVRIRSWISENNIKQFGGDLAPMYDIPQMEEPMDDRRLSVEVSAVQALNEDIVNILSTLEFFENALGAPELVFSQEYKDLRNLRKLYFNRLEDKVSLEKFFKFYKWFDDTVGDIIEEFLPSSTNYLGTNFIVESHMLERAKFVYNYSDMYVGEIDRLEVGSIFLQQFLINLRKF